MTDGQRSGGATTAKEAAAISARVSTAGQTRARDHRSRARRTPGRSSVGSANHAVSGRRLNANAAAGAAAERGAVPVNDLERGAGRSRLDAKPGQPVEPADDRAQSPVAARSGRGGSPGHGWTGTAQTTSTAMPRSENTCTDADVSIIRWKTTATHTAA